MSLLYSAIETEEHDASSILRTIVELGPKYLLGRIFLGLFNPLQLSFNTTRLDRFVGLFSIEETVSRK